MLQLISVLLFIIHLAVSRGIQQAFATPVARPHVRKRGQTVINVSVVQPKLCTTSALAFSTKTAIPTGTFQIIDNVDTGWGPPGSIWNISTDGTVAIKSLRAPCQGSSCLGWNGVGNKQSSGIIQKVTDYLWQLNVTADMQPSVMLFGEIGDVLVNTGNASNTNSSASGVISGLPARSSVPGSLVNTAASRFSVSAAASGFPIGGVISGSSINAVLSRSSTNVASSCSSAWMMQPPNPSKSANLTYMNRLVKRQSQSQGNGKFNLIITSTPPCALPVAENCSDRNFLPDSSQWQAYSMDKWLSDYIPKRGVQDFDQLYNSLAWDYLTASQRAIMNCGPDSRAYLCTPPAGADLIYTCPSQDAAPGIIALWSVIRISNILRFIYATFDSVESDVSNWVEQLVDTFVKPTVEQKWTLIITAASAIFGILIAFAILIDVFTAGGATGVTSGILVAAVVGITNTLGAASSFKNGFETQLPDDTYLKYTGQYKQGVTQWALFMRNTTAELWAPSNPEAFGGDTVMRLLAGGNWLTVPNPLNVTGLGTAVNNWFDITLLASLINQSWKNNKFYIQFVPYGMISDLQLNGRDAKMTNFTKEQCEQHWANDPRRPNYISCDLHYGIQEGMTVLSQPSSTAGNVMDLIKGVAFAEPQIGYTFKTDDLLQSSLTGNYQYGYNYNVTLEQMNDVIKHGAAGLANSFKPLDLNAPGLYNLDVCVLDQLTYVSGSLQYIKSNGRRFSKNQFSWNIGCDDPCPCKNFAVHGQKFTNYTNPDLVDLLEKPSTSFSKDPCYTSCIFASRKL